MTTSTLLPLLLDVYSVYADGRRDPPPPPRDERRKPARPGRPSQRLTLDMPTAETE